MRGGESLTVLTVNTTKRGRAHGEIQPTQQREPEREAAQGRGRSGVSGRPRLCDLGGRSKAEEEGGKTR